jgi:hypothetical protein
MKNKFKKAISVLLIVAGCLQFAGYIFKMPALRGLGIAYCVGPLPTVFSTVGGVEGFTTRHSIHFTDDKGYAGIIKLDQHFFSRFRGHYFLKQSYSLFLAYSHMLKPRQVAGAVDFALCKRNIFSRFGVKDKITSSFIEIKRRRFDKPEDIILVPKCSD